MVQSALSSRDENREREFRREVMPDLVSPNSPTPTLVWGGGAIGGTMAAYLARAGHPTILVDVVQEHVEACRGAGLTVEGSVDNFTQRLKAYTPAEVEGKYQRIILAVKAQHTGLAMDMLSPHLHEHGYVLSAQNGLNEREIAGRVGEDRTMGCFVNFGADWVAPGRIVYGGRGEVVIGELSGSSKPRTWQMRRILRKFEPNTQVTENIWGYLWGKLAFASMLFATSLTNDGMDASFADPRRFKVFHTLGREVVDVATASGVKAMPVAGFMPDAFSRDAAEEEARSCIEALAVRRRGSAKVHSGFWRDLAIRKRKTEVDSLLGVILDEARKLGVETPMLARLVEVLHTIEEGEMDQSWESFETLLQVTAD